MLNSGVWSELFLVLKVTRKRFNRGVSLTLNDCIESILRILNRVDCVFFINEITGNGLLFEVNLDFFCFLIQLDLLFFRDVRIW